MGGCGFFKVSYYVIGNPRVLIIGAVHKANTACGSSWGAWKVLEKSLLPKGPEESASLRRLI